MWRWSGLRARVAANLAAAVVLAFAFLTVSVMAIMQRAMRDAERVGFLSAADLLAGEVRLCHDDPCLEGVKRRAAFVGLSIEFHPGSVAGTAPALVPASAVLPARLSVERRVDNRVMEIGAPVAPMMERAREALTALLACLLVNAIALVIIGTGLFERGVVRRLSQMGEDMVRIERFELEAPLLASDEGDEIGRMAGTLNRITQRLREDKRRTADYIEKLEQTNRELSETREGLARSERLATVGRLAAGVAHEIGNPIAAILGYLEIIRLGKGAATGEYVERIDRETRRVDRIVRDLLDFAKPQPLSIGPVSLGEVVAAAARLVQPQPRWRSMTLTQELAEGLPLIAAQDHYATQVLLNLFINAADACDGSGQVTVRARSGQPGRVVLEVADDGPGIKPEDVGRIFDPFFTTKAPGEGSGLGLAISHRLMESFGGTISFSPRSPHGAVFTLEFRSFESASAHAAA